MPPLVTLPVDTSAAILQRAGLAMLGRLANVQALVDGVPVVGCLVERPQLADLGLLQAQTALLRFTCAAGDLPPGTQEGTAITIGAASYVVAQRTDVADIGHAELALERP